MQLVLVGLGWLLTAVLAVVLVLRYRATRSPGYLVLLVPLVLWGAVARLLHDFVDRQVQRSSAGEPLSWPLTLMGDASTGEVVAAILYVDGLARNALIVTGFLLLGRSESSRREVTSEAP